jgi:hypothetical protein
VFSVISLHGEAAERIAPSIFRARVVLGVLSDRSFLDYTGLGLLTDPAVSLISVSAELGSRGNRTMVPITFSDRETEKRALGFLLGRFSGRVLRSGEHLVPKAALEALANQNIPFTVPGKSTYEQQMAAIRGSAPQHVGRAFLPDGT